MNAGLQHVPEVEDECRHCEDCEVQGVSGYGAVFFFPNDCRLVALDIDLHPNTEKRRREASIPVILELAAELSESHGLGQYWIYQTGNGWHILFEKPAETFTLWAQAYLDAINPDGRWGEDYNHADHCLAQCAPTLRVGLKHGREPDIWLRWGKIRDDAPEHVKLHDDAIHYFQQPGAFDRWLHGDINSPIALS